MDESPDLRMLFHQLNNQLGIILANAELLEAKTTDATNRARAGCHGHGPRDSASFEHFRRLNQVSDTHLTP